MVNNCFCFVPSRMWVMSMASLSLHQLMEHLESQQVFGGWILWGREAENGKCILYNQRDATYTVFFIIISLLHVSGGFSAHYRELIKLYVHLWMLSSFSALYRWCGWLGNFSKPSEPAVDSRKAWQYTRLHIQFYKLLVTGGNTARTYRALIKIKNIV